MDTTPDFESAPNYLHRVERFRSTKYPFSQEKGEQWASLATADGVLENTNNQVVLEDGQLKINLFSKANTKGFYVDDAIRVMNNWLHSLRPSDERSMAIEALNVALLLLDRNAVKAHNYNESFEERANPPDIKTLLPDAKRWEEIRQAASVPQDD